MSLHRRLTRLHQRLPEPRPAGIPTDPGAILEGLMAGRLTVADLDPTDPDQVSALGRLAAMLAIRAAEGELPASDLGIRLNREDP